MTSDRKDSMNRSILPMLVRVEAHWADGEGWVPTLGAVCEASVIATEVAELRAAGARARVAYYGGVLEPDYLAGYGIAV